MDIIIILNLQSYLHNLLLQYTFSVLIWHNTQFVKDNNYYPAKKILLKYILQIEHWAIAN